jgi:flagellar biosynthesis/type III secretory pathway M-ring protein FliF/YscJ
MLLKEYGLPAWGSYVLFAVATILLGAILGLLLVCVIDFIFPPKHTQRGSFAETKQQPQDERDEIQGDELEDEDEQVGSDREKFSGSDSETPENDKQSPPGSPAKKTGEGDAPTVRSRKTRKAD